ncbi:MAG: hypothetical protein JW751_25770 [Polyangiaceae bacterium]|nr:hypothetical protein [Polyangiaceae bacterium]
MTKPPTVLIVSIVVLAVFLVVLVVNVARSGPDLIALAGSTVVLTVLVLVASKIESVRKLAVGEVQAEFDEVKTEVKGMGLEFRAELADFRRRLDHVIVHSMSAPMYENLQKLASGRFGPYEMTEGLRRELYHLRDVGYIDVQAIRAIPVSGSELSEHVAATRVGREFVDLRRQIEDHRESESGAG